MLFTGTYEHAIDTKNRLSIPAQIRSQMDPRRDGPCWYIVPGRPASTLWLYTQRHFEALCDTIGPELIPDDAVLSFEQEFFPKATLLEPDPQGRVLIPDWLLKQSGIGREVVICGVRDHLEIRRRDEWARSAEAGWKMFPELQLKARRALEQRRRQSGQGPDNT
jgi:MraZ protein